MRLGRVVKLSEQIRHFILLEAQNFSKVSSLLPSNYEFISVSHKYLQYLSSYIIIKYGMCDLIFIMYIPYFY